MDTKKTLIAGGGLSAMILARMIKRYRNPEADILIVEKEPKLGGQYSSFHYNGYGYFDIGMHMYYEACVPEIDELLTGILPEEEWNILENNFKDVAGVFYKGKLQHGTPYVDLRSFPKEKWSRYVSDIFSAIRDNGEKDYPAGANAYESLVYHFGQSVADEIFVPIFEKIYFTHARNLDNSALHLTTVNRVALFNADIMEDLMRSEGIRARICYPDQLNMPPFRRNLQRGFYPRKFGFVHVIEKLQSVLEKEGISFITSGTISDLEIKGHSVTGATIKQKDGTQETIPVKEIFWTAGIPSMAGALKINTGDLSFERKQTEDVYINFLFDKRPSMGKLHHFFCFDEGYGSYRVTNCSNFCPEAAKDGRYPLCIEYWIKPGGPKTEEEILQAAKKELYDFGVISDDYSVIFSKVEKKTGLGFPLPSVQNMENLETIKKRIQEKEIRNVISTGVFSEKNVFFIADVLIDTYRKVTGENVQVNELDSVNINSAL